MASSRKKLLGEDEVTEKDGQALPATEGADAAADTDEDAGDDEDLSAPPEADTVALRALAVAAMLRRADLEAKQAKGDVARLQAWVDEHGLFAAFGPEGFELFGLPPGKWSAEDRGAVAWAAEELHLLLWALGRREAPPLFTRADAAALTAAVPLLASPDAFVGGAALRPVEELEVLRALWDTLHESIHCEAWARGVLEDPSLAADESLAEALGTVEGFDFAAASGAEGAPAAAVRGLRLISRQLVQGLFDAGSPHSAAAFAPAQLESLPEDQLAVAMMTARVRAAALAWLTEGDEWDFEQEPEADS